MYTTPRLLVLIASLALGLASCQDKEKEMQDLRVTQRSNVEGGPELVEGRLRFASLENFQAFLKANQDMTTDQLMQLDKEMGFVSHLRLGNEPGLEPPRPVAPSALHCLGPNAAEQPADAPELRDVTEFDIADPLLAAALNEDREVQIGNLIYRPGNDYTFFYPVGQANLVDDFYKKLDQGEVRLEDSEIRAIGELAVANTQLVTNPTPGSPQNSALANRSVDQNSNWDGDHRIECQIWQGNWIVYASSGIKTHATQYARKYLFFHGWVDLVAQTVSATAQVTFQQVGGMGGYPPYYFPPTTQTAQVLSISENNAAVAVKRFDWAVAQIGYTNAPGGINTQVQAILSQMVVVVTNPRPTIGGATQSIHIDRLTSTYNGRWNNRNVPTLTLTW